MPPILVVLLVVLVIVIVVMAVRSGALNPPYDPLRVLLWVVVILIALALIWYFLRATGGFR
jgi:hypothetical protein